MKIEESMKTKNQNIIDTISAKLNEGEINIFLKNLSRLFQDDEFRKIVTEKAKLKINLLTTKKLLIEEDMSELQKEIRKLLLWKEKTEKGETDHILEMEEFFNKEEFAEPSNQINTKLTRDEKGRIRRVVID